MNVAREINKMKKQFISEVTDAKITNLLDKIEMVEELSKYSIERTLDLNSNKYTVSILINMDLVDYFKSNGLFAITDNAVLNNHNMNFKEVYVEWFKEELPRLSCFLGNIVDKYDIIIDNLITKDNIFIGTRDGYIYPDNPNYGRLFIVYNILSYNKSRMYRDYLKEIEYLKKD